MDKKTDTKDILLNDVPLAHLAVIEREANRQNRNRVAQIRHILEQAARQIVLTEQAASIDLDKVS